MLKLAIENKSKTPYDIFHRTVSSISTQVKRDFSPAWGLDAQIFVPLVEDRPNNRIVRGTPPRPDTWKVTVFDDREQAAVEGFEQTRTTDVAIFVDELKLAGLHWTVNLSQAVLELLADPYVNCSMQSGLRFVALDVCSPVASDECAYRIGEVFMSDFVLPAWYDEDSSGPFSFRKNAPAALTPAENGFWSEWVGAEWVENGNSPRMDHSFRLWLRS